MCGRYFLDTLPELLAEQFRSHKHPVYQVSYNIAPSQPVLAFRRHGPSDEWASLSWGLVPSWSRDPKMGVRSINARAETAADKPMFRQAMRHRRCVVPASGYYEWQKSGDRKTPYAIVPTEDPALGFAAIWEHHTDAEARVLESVAILTTTPTAALAEIHDRMPVMLRRDHYRRWIDGENIGELLTSGYAPVRAYVVSNAVGNVRNNSPALIAPR
jgi:putative SOS response-associated peptidase YedK